MALHSKASRLIETGSIVWSPRSYAGVREQFAHPLSQRSVCQDDVLNLDSLRAVLRVILLNAVLRPYTSPSSIANDPFVCSCYRGGHYRRCDYRSGFNNRPIPHHDRF